MPNKESTPDIRIYAACLAAYNNGILHGRWIGAQQDEGVIRGEINAMLAASPIKDAEEFAIHDHEGFAGAPVSEYSGIAEIVELTAFIGEHGALGSRLIDYFGDVETARTAIEDHYAGEYGSVVDFAEELTEQSTDIPENLRSYIDYERMARDLEINDVTVIETGFEQVHVFWCW